MSDKPQEDILDQIITQGLNQMDAPQKPPQEEAPQQAPPQEEAATGEAPAAPARDGKTASPARKQDKRSAVYIYLLILFGAAFMMLLLAYFVQQRSNASTIDELRSSMNLSREELLEQIETLERQNEILTKSLTANGERAEQAETQQRIAANEAEELQERLLEKDRKLAAAITLGYLERFCAEQDWLMAAAIVEDSDDFFNEHNEHFSNKSLVPAQAARYLELREEVLKQPGCMVLTDYPERPGQWESVYIDTEDGVYDVDSVSAAKKLNAMLSYVSLGGGYYVMAQNHMMNCYLDGIGLERLKTLGFRPSTVELYEQTMDQFNADGHIALEKHEDGTVSFLVGNDAFITFNVDTAEIIQCDVPLDEVVKITDLSDLPEIQSSLYEMPAGE